MTRDNGKDNDKKRGMNRGSSKDMKKAPTLTLLYDNRLLCSKVNEALDTGIPYQEIIELCEDYGLKLSPSALTRYRDKREESLRTGVDLGELIDKRKKSGNIVSLSAKRQNLGPIDELTPDNRIDYVNENFKTLYNDVELLDTIIQKAFNSASDATHLDADVGIRAIGMKDKITGGKVQGLSLVGLRELSFRTKARASALNDVVMSYIPEELHEEVYETIKEAEQEFYENLDISAEGKRITEALRSSNIDI